MKTEWCGVWGLKVGNIVYNTVVWILQLSCILNQIVQYWSA